MMAQTWAICRGARWSRYLITLGVGLKNHIHSGFLGPDSLNDTVSGRLCYMLYTCIGAQRIAASAYSQMGDGFQSRVYHAQGWCCVKATNRLMMLAAMPKACATRSAIAVCNHARPYSLSGSGLGLCPQRLHLESWSDAGAHQKDTPHQNTRAG